MVDCCTAPGLMPLELAKKQLLENISSVEGTEMVAISTCQKRVNAQAIKSPLNVPAHNNSAMDGYAFNAANAANNVVAQGEMFKLVGTAMAGSPFTKVLGPGECIRIMTGAVVPDSANTVEMQENVTVVEDSIRLNQDLSIGEHIRYAGEDIAQGKIVFEAGHLFNSADIGLLASLGIAQVEVKRKPTIAVFSTGDELKSAGQPLELGDIYESNRHVIIAMLKNMNLNVIDYGIIPDNYEEIKQAFIDANQNADAVISSGGVSVGDADYTKEVLAELGQIDFWKIAIKPGKPFAFGRLSDSVFFGLPGNPVSATVTFHLLAVQALRKMMGTKYPDPMLISATTRLKIKKRAGRMDFQRGIASVDSEGKLSVTPLSHQGSGILSSISQANCYIVLPIDHQGCEAGEQVKIQLFDSVLG